MASEREIFSLSGPLHLTAIDWRNTDYRRSIAASLVQSVYILERDRQQIRQGPNALAPPWWEFFHFRLIQVLVDNEDQSYFGAIYEYKFPNSHFHYKTMHGIQSQNQNQNPPKYVIAFRGTIAKKGNRSQDFKLDLRLIRNNLHNCSRFHIGFQAVQNIVQNHGASDIWLAGHSLGSSIALLIGRDMVKMGIHLEAYLFNPPFTSLPIEKITKNAKLKHGIRIAHSVLTAGLAGALNNHKPKALHKSDSFTLLSSWVPYLFVNPSDPICAEYIGYFEHREKMVAIGAGEIGRIATQNSIRNIIANATGKDQTEPSHLIPSAFVTINLSPSPDFKRAHGIHQWWKPDIQCNYKMYQFR
ncbi:GDSL esterase/lipase [Capsicum annuum]|uniref:GDSL esterase/lipase n=1 Tax=Capsicum annuum TaxID=4072 RepID=A0A1U8G8S0_CAPAN|nr:GDSL esterase/lipase At4g10955 [Capsicum annuum]XP_016564424.1 GDSL esterase/lipase At4g10955 [Capsicum annuum]KAF3623335.1 GDSL esterase/lipase [Capsicum annuum]PHT87493.1 GDSL esterase/lipase [Capsicum annuum]